VYREFLTALSQPVNGGGVPEFLRVMAMDELMVRKIWRKR